MDRYDHAEDMDFRFQQFLPADIGMGCAKVESEGEAMLARDLKAHNISFERQFKFHETRKWRSDFLITGHKLLVEVEGGI